MPTTTVPGFILDAYGRPATFSAGTGNLYRRTAADERAVPDE